MNKIGFQHREFVVKDYRWDGESRTISGYAAVFGNVDRVDDVLLKGCFAKSIMERGPQSDAKGKILLLWQHMADEPLGRITKLYEDDYGLYFEAELDEFELADRAIKQLVSGTLNQFSIGFKYVWNAVNTDPETGINYISEVKLYEISIVSVAANPETEFLGMKGGIDDTDAFAKDVADFAKGMPVDKEMKFQKLIAKAMSLGAIKPQESALEDVQADRKGLSVFDLIKG